MEAERGLCDDSIKSITDADASLRGQLKERGEREREREGMMIYWKLLGEGERAVMMRGSFLMFSLFYAGSH